MLFLDFFTVMKMKTDLCFQQMAVSQCGCKIHKEIVLSFVQSTNALMANKHYMLGHIKY